MIRSFGLRKALRKLLFTLGAAGLFWVFVYVPNSCGCGYTPRAQVSEGMNLAAAAKAAITETWLRNKAIPRNRAEAGMSPEPHDTHGKYVQSLAIENGRIDITYGNEADKKLIDRVLSLTPYLDESIPDRPMVVWRCGEAAMPGGETRELGEHRAGDVPVTLLPSTCR
jgi:type IV pilus assembly protein PilA